MKDLIENPCSTRSDKSIGMSYFPVEATFRILWPEMWREVYFQSRIKGVNVRQDRQFDDHWTNEIYRFRVNPDFNISLKILFVLSSLPKSLKIGKAQFLSNPLCGLAARKTLQRLRACWW